MPNSDWKTANPTMGQPVTLAEFKPRDSDMVAVFVHTKPCLQCKKTSTLTVPKAGYDAWCAGKYIQTALPMLDDDQRELLMTGTHRACWDEIFPPEEDDD